LTFRAKKWHYLPTMTITKNQTAVLRHIKDRVEYDLKRADFQIANFRAAPNKENYRYDHLRAAVVFLHMNLDSALREVLRIAAKNGDRTTLKSFCEKRCPSLDVGILPKYREGSAQDLIDDIVDKCLAKSTFNGMRDISNALETIGFRKDSFEVDFRNLVEMMAKRHSICHRGDRIPADENHHGALQSITLKEVNKWRSSTASFVIELLEKALDSYREERVRPVSRVRG
jgi:hypothetical protein